MATKKTTTKSKRAGEDARAIEGPRYLVLEASQIDNKLVAAGEEITYYGMPGSKLKPVNGEAKSRKQEVHDIRTDASLTDDERGQALADLSDEWNGVEGEDAWAEGEFGLSDKPLPEGDRKELEAHSQAAIEAEAEKQKDDTNYTKIKLQGKLEETEASKQGATPATDGKKK